MCNIIQSFYSHNCADFNLFVQACYFTLSSLYVNELGCPATLYTDYEFGQCLEKAPYKEIKNVFDNHEDCAKINTLVWAWPKFLSLDMCPRDTIHIDGDVFLKPGFDKSYLDFTDCDVICQHLEKWDHWICHQTSWTESFNSIKHFDFPEKITKEIPTCMFNTGVLGVNNEQLWNEYKESYWKMVSQSTPGSIDPIGWCVPDIIFEQYFLKELCEKDGYRVRCLLNGGSLQDINNAAIAKHYQHVCSDKKLHLKKCLKVIKKKSAKCYEMLKSNWFDKFSEYFEE